MSCYLLESCNSSLVINQTNIKFYSACPTNCASCTSATACTACDAGFWGTTCQSRK